MGRPASLLHELGFLPLPAQSVAYGLNPAKLVRQPFPHQNEGVDFLAPSFAFACLQKLFEEGSAPVRDSALDVLLLLMMLPQPCSGLVAIADGSVGGFVFHGESAGLFPAAPCCGVSIASEKDKLSGTASGHSSRPSNPPQAKVTFSISWTQIVHQSDSPCSMSR